ncbi:hypothetical protein F4775DRAFT_595781 [Biscogniauxia sp. FL1348]|nr:hypothetical protein F4775DRAFT_595781 [Biscogniauxia sp. FL1348]
MTQHSQRDESHCRLTLDTVEVSPLKRPRSTRRVKSSRKTWAGNKPAEPIEKIFKPLTVEISEPSSRKESPIDPTRLIRMLSQKSTALFQAASDRDVDRLLRERGAELDNVDTDDGTPVQIATIRGHPDMDWGSAD